MSNQNLTFESLELKMTPSDHIANFNAWVNSSPTGAKFTYWTGFLCKDRELQHNKQICHVIANRAWKLYERGVLTLIQRKIAPDQYQYVAVKCAKN